MSVPVLVRHDHGCKWSRATDVDIDSAGKVISAVIGPAHSDAAKRFSDWYNLHKAAGAVRGWIAVALADGASDGNVYDTRQEAVSHCWPNERWFFYAVLEPASMSVCAAESVLRWKRIMNEMEAPDRDAKHGGLEVVPFLTAEDREQQVTAVRTGRGLLPMAHRQNGNRKG